MAPKRVQVRTEWDKKGILALIAWTIWLTGFPSAFAQDGSAIQTSGTQHDDAPKITMSGLLRFLAHDAKDQAAEAFVLKLIERYGIGFRPSSSDFGALRAASASEKLLGAIEAAKMPPAPTIREGTLAVRCAPVDCEVLINGSPHGETNQGRDILLTMPEGHVSVAAKRLGYDLDGPPRDIQIAKDELVEVKFDLKKSRATLREAGAQMLRSMVAALGEISATNQTFRSLRLFGTVYLHDSSDRLAIWPVDGWLTDFHLADLGIAGETGRKRLANLRQKPDLASSIRQLLDGQLQVVLPKLLSDTSTVIADESLVGSLPKFRVDQPGQSYLVMLDAANRPSEIVVSPSASGPQVRFLYSDYATMGSACVPLRTQVVSGDRNEGVELQIGVLRPEQAPPANGRPARQRKDSGAAKRD